MISGCSSGIGAAVTQLASKESIPTLGLSRRETTGPPEFEHLLWDMSQDFKSVEGNFRQTLVDRVKRHSSKKVVLINNAANLGTVGSALSGLSNSMLNSLKVNFLSHRDLTVSVCNIARDLDLEVDVVTVSSGVVTNPVEGWAEYNVGKAALDIWFRTLFLEKINWLRLGIVYPGVVDTKMQQSVRSLTASQMPDVEKFRDFFSQGKLASTTVVAKKIFKILDRSDFGNYIEHRLNEY